MNAARLVSSADNIDCIRIARIRYVLIRIVRMTFRSAAVEEFLTLFDDSSGRIREFDGCHHLELWQNVEHPNVFTTYSLWSDAKALDFYRRSELFRSTWNDVKVLFAAPPEVSSHTRTREIS